MKESQKKWFDRVRMAVQVLGTRLFRNNVGVARFTDKKGKKHVVVYGLAPGTSDLIGWTPVTVTAAMVGSQIAIFTALEGKRGKDKLDNDQQNFIEVLRRQGGIAGVFETEADAMAVVEDWMALRTAAPELPHGGS